MAQRFFTDQLLFSVLSAVPKSPGRVCTSKGNKRGTGCSCCYAIDCLVAVPGGCVDKSLSIPFPHLQRTAVSYICCYCLTVKCQPCILIGLRTQLGWPLLHPSDHVCTLMRMKSVSSLISPKVAAKRAAWAAC